MLTKNLGELSKNLDELTIFLFVWVGFWVSCPGTENEWVHFYMKKKYKKMHGYVMVPQSREEPPHQKKPTHASCY